MFNFCRDGYWQKYFKDEKSPNLWYCLYFLFCLLLSQTGLTPLMEAASGGFHEVGKVLINKVHVQYFAHVVLCRPVYMHRSFSFSFTHPSLSLQGADVNAAPVPSSRDTALTIAADKGHYRFVKLLLRHAANVDVKNKKGNSPLWLASNGMYMWPILPVWQGSHYASFKGVVYLVWS